MQDTYPLKKVSLKKLDPIRDHLKGMNKIQRNALLKFKGSDGSFLKAQSFGNFILITMTLPNSVFQVVFIEFSCFDEDFSTFMVN